jgi:hypothetical protein
MLVSPPLPLEELEEGSCLLEEPHARTNEAPQKAHPGTTQTRALDLAAMRQAYPSRGTDLPT